MKCRQENEGGGLLLRCSVLFLVIRPMHKQRHFIKSYLKLDRTGNCCNRSAFFCWSYTFSLFAFYFILFIMNSIIPIIVGKSTHHTHDDVVMLLTIHYYNNRNDKQLLRGSYSIHLPTKSKSHSGYKPFKRQ